MQLQKYKINLYFSNSERKSLGERRKNCLRFCDIASHYTNAHEKNESLKSEEMGRSFFLCGKKELPLQPF